MPSKLPILVATLIGTASCIAAQAAPAPVPPSDHPVLRQIQGDISADHLQATLTHLVGFGTRHTLSETRSDSNGIGAARRWVRDQLRSIGKDCGDCLDVEMIGDTVTGPRIPKPTAVIDVVAIQKAVPATDRYVLITGHIDSRVTDIMNSTAAAPGADDDGSGVAAVIEAARVLSRYKFHANVVYAALSGEEQGLYGGKILAAHARKAGWKIEADLNNDIIGNIHGIDGVVDNTHVRVFSEGIKPTASEADMRYLRYRGGELDSASRNVSRYLHRLAHEYIPNLDVMQVYRLDRFGRGGDHSAFNDLGFPAVRLTEPHENYDRQHQDVRIENGVHYGDVLSGVDFPYLAKVTALNAIGLAAMAWAPAPPQAVGIKGAVSPDTALSWRKVPGAVGYRIYWRLTTDPTWTHSRYAGDVDSATLHDIVIDNYFFGVASVSADGFESPVVFPGPNGDFAAPAR